MALYPLNPSGGIRSPRSGELAGDDWFASQGPPQMMPGGVTPDQRALQDFSAGGGGNPGWVTEEGLPARPPDLETAAQLANQIAYGGQGGGDVEYWRSMWQKDPGYAWKRMLGWQAGGKDVATSGPFAGAAAGGGGGAAGGGFGAGGFGDPSQMMASLEQSPGFQFRLGEGLKALEKSAAARGTLLTGGTLKGLQRYAQDFASNEYDKRYNQLLGMSQLGLDAAKSQGLLGSSYAGQAGNILGGQATQIGGSFTDQGKTIADLITGRGNAQAAGTVGSANAWQQGINSGTNNALQTILLSQMMNGGGNSGAPAVPGYVPYGVVPYGPGM